MIIRVSNLTQGTELGSSITIANTFFTRLVGLLNRPYLLMGEGLLLTGTNAVHTWGMRFTIDCLFLDRQLRIVRAVPSLKPWRYSPLVRKAWQVLELPVGTIERTGTRPGDQLWISSTSEDSV